MLKDPAFMVFASDFMMETSFMTTEETGMYIKILCNMHFHGHLAKKELEFICGREIPFGIIRNLEMDEDGSYYHKRMDYEAEKRTKYTESRQKNLKKKSEEKKDEVAEPQRDEEKPYGPYKNVMLTDEEYEELSDKFRTGLDERIKQLSEYMKISGKTYKSHYAVIIQWDEKNKEKAAEEQGNELSTFDTDDFFEAAVAHSRQYYSCSKDRNTG